MPDFNPALPSTPKVYEAEQAILRRWKEYTARIDVNGTENPDFAKGMACGLQEALFHLQALRDD